MHCTQHCVLWEHLYTGKYSSKIMTCIAAFMFLKMCCAVWADPNLQYIVLKNICKYWKYLSDESWKRLYWLAPVSTCVMARRLKTAGPDCSVWILNSEIHFILDVHKSKWHTPNTIFWSSEHNFIFMFPDKKSADVSRIPKIWNRIQLNNI